MCCIIVLLHRHPTSSASAAEIMSVLFFHVMKYSSELCVGVRERVGCTSCRCMVKCCSCRIHECSIASDKRKLKG